MSQAVVRRHLSQCAFNFHHAEKATCCAICREITWMDPPKHKASNTALVLQESVQSCSVHQSQRNVCCFYLAKKISRCHVCNWKIVHEGNESTQCLSLCHPPWPPHKSGIWAITERFQVIVFRKEALLGKWRHFPRLYTKLVVDLGTLGLLPPLGIWVLVWFLLRSLLFRKVMGKLFVFMLNKIKTGLNQRGDHLPYQIFLF